VVATPKEALEGRVLIRSVDAGIHEHPVPLSRLMLVGAKPRREPLGAEKGRARRTSDEGGMT